MEKKSRTNFLSSSRLLRTKSSRVGVSIILAFVILIIIGPFLTPYAPTQTSSSKNSPPSFAHPFGTDYLGHDVLSQVIYGAYPSMIIGVLGATGSVLVGLTVGVMAGYFRKLEGVLTGTADVVLTFPPLPLMILLGSLYPATTSLIILILIIVLWPVSARSIRSQVLSIKERPYVRSAKTSGMGDLEIVRRVIIPEVASLAIAYFVLTVAAAIVLVTDSPVFGSWESGCRELGEHTLLGTAVCVL